jgi:hypothetical protein
LAEIVQLSGFEWFLEHSDIAVLDDLDETKMDSHRIGGGGLVLRRSSPSMVDLV